jgi:hypothetical protein
MCAIQLPALLAIVLILIRGRYSTHPFIFWLVVILAIIASWFWSIVRAGEHISGTKSERISMLIELAGNLCVAASWISSVVGMVIAFV